jgi:hypothetical protein
LFGILQVVFSVVFTWLVARSASEQEFRKRQKAFAISAYRRIREISRAADRMLNRASRQTRDASQDLSRELEVMREISIGICDTAESSVADWSDLIGEEISALEKIEELRSQVREHRNQSGYDDDVASDREISQDRISSIVEKLIADLPPELQIEASKNTERNSGYFKNIEAFESSMAKDSYIDLDGFWEPNEGFDESIEIMSVGEDAWVAVGDATARITALLLHDDNGNKLGVKTNSIFPWGEGSYSEFLNAVTSSMGSSRFPVKIVEIELQKSDSKGINFVVRLFSNAIIDQELD